MKTAINQDRKKMLTKIRITKTLDRREREMKKTYVQRERERERDSQRETDRETEKGRQTDREIHLQGYMYPEQTDEWRCEHLPLPEHRAADNSVRRTQTGICSGGVHNRDLHVQWCTPT